MENLRTRTTYFFIGLNMIIFWSSCVFYHSMSLPEETALSGITIPFVVSSSQSWYNVEFGHTGPGHVQKSKMT